MSDYLTTGRTWLVVRIIAGAAIVASVSGLMLRSFSAPPRSSATSNSQTFSGDNGAWSDAAHLIQGRIYGDGLTLPDGRVLLIGGFNTPGSQEAELYDPTTNTWTQTFMNSRRVSPAVVLLPSGKVLVAGGYCECTGSGYTNTAELFDPATNSWTLTGSMNDIHQADTAVLLPNGKVLIAGGASLPFGPSTSAELYDPATGQWSYTGSLNVPRRYYFMTVLPSGKALIVGGGSASDGTPTNTTELYDPSTGTWTLSGNLYYGVREQNSGAVLPNGRVFIVGGDNGASLLNTTELYDPNTGTWSPGPSTQTPLWAPQPSDGLLPLNNGKYIMIGSQNFAPTSTSSQIYDPATNSWGDYQTLLHYQYGGFAAKLADGRILYAGGTDPSDPTQGIYTEIYGPSPVPEVFILLQGLDSSLTPDQISGGTTPGFATVQSAIQATIPGATFVTYSYAGPVSQTDSTPTPYQCTQTLLNPLSTDIQVLDRQIQAVLASHPGADIYLVGHSLGGVVAYGYLAALTETAGIVTPFPTNAHLRGVITLDSPIGGISSNNKYFTDAVSFYEASCSGVVAKLPTALLNLSTIFDSTKKSTPPDSAAPDPQGAQASILSIPFSKTKPHQPYPSNQQVAEDTQLQGTAVLTVGNNNDLLWQPSQCFPKLQDFTDTQWLEDEGSGSNIYGRIFTSGTLFCPIGGTLGWANHFAVLTDSSVMEAIQAFVPNGATPSALLAAPPGPD